MTHPPDPETPIACDLGAIPPDQRAAHLSLAARVLGESPLEVMERPDGLSFRFGEEHYAVIVELIGQERQCCPFFRFVLDVAPAHGSVWLHVTGPPEGTAILRTAGGR